MKKAYMITASEVAELLNVSLATAYRQIAVWNEQLKNEGYFTIQGRISRAYVLDHCYGLEETEVV